MAPAEIWQNGKLINTINEGGCTHEGVYNKKHVKVSGSFRGCFVSHLGFLSPGNSITLDDGVVVVSTVGDPIIPESFKA